MTAHTSVRPTDDAAPTSLDFGRPTWRLRTKALGPLGPVTALSTRRGTLVVCLLAAACGLTWLVALMYGQYPVPPSGVLAAFRGEADALTELVVMTWRLPRAVAAMSLGAALAVSGAIFQSLTRNPLGSPDIIGFNTGAFTGATIVILYFPATFLLTAAGAFIGGLITAAVVYTLARTGGTFRSFRLIVIGIGVAAMLSSLNTAMITNAEVEEAITVALWGAGSLKALTFTEVLPAAALAIIGMTAVGILATRLKLLELGDDLAATLGVPIHTTRLALIALGVLLTALCAATAGPISFIALAAPQLARRLVDSDGVPLVSSALLGALLLQISDIIAENIYPPSPLPVGVVTVCLGGGYFIWLLITQVRKS